MKLVLVHQLMILCAILLSTLMTCTKSDNDEGNLKNSKSSKERSRFNATTAMNDSNIVLPRVGKFIPAIGSRNIITVPSNCPPGQQKDRNGRCRVIMLVIFAFFSAQILIISFFQIISRE